MKLLQILFVLILVLPSASSLEPEISTTQGLEQAIKLAQPGSILTLSNNEYNFPPTLQTSGTQEKPITIKGNGAIFNGNINLQASYWILEDLTFKDPIFISGNNNIIRDSTIKDLEQTAITIKGNNNLIENNEFSNIDSLNKWFYFPIIFILLGILLVTSAYYNKKIFIILLILNLIFAIYLLPNGGYFHQNKDAHAVMVWQGSENNTIQNNLMYQLSGDGIHVINDNQRQGRLAKDVRILNNQIYAVRENCIDVKTSQNVLIQDNECSGVLPSFTSSDGTGIIIHAGADNVKILNNQISNTRRGISVTKGSVSNSPTEYPGEIEITHNTITSPIDTGEGWASGSGIVLGQADSILVQENHVQDAHDFALGLTEKANEESITLISNNLQGNLHLNKGYQNLNSENNNIEGDIEFEGTIQDIEILGFTKTTIKEKIPINNLEFYQNINKEKQLRYSQLTWLLLAITSLFILKKKTYKKKQKKN
tara:strand:- start:2371 stop:3816 length:1446 start_codon:yes stop_codon:yes gene_type:complete